MRLRQLKFAIIALALAAIPLLQACEDGDNPLNTGGNALTNDEVIAGLKQALEVGTDTTVNILSKTNAYFGDAALKILLPPEAVEIEQQLRRNAITAQYVDKVVLEMNRAAESAATEARPIFVDAIRGMTIADGMTILKGDSVAATRYLADRTTAGLTDAYMPKIRSAMENVGAQQTWKTLAQVWNAVPLNDKKLPEDISAHVNNRALHGLFETIKKQETAIRQDPLRRVTDLLRRVFGWEG